ncbi:MAG: bis(5'-nucleosyl)-tetraphosphatase (symmetrical) YqeK [Thermoanaerobacteraceae bacterium]|uniref:bis(5'-nucleosyl)-tetraphosphatase (symmetrical) YqeK n=1 Tax=Thermanaeromonas sp. C210 TaxID=2731925 RepID=UPI00155B48A3|nr:bis(5'-nucleosyl)-tetraphosphatase (symmetrical) YqeK [Thermanaeromonas sp. C210]MBE3580088.1 bis(5'-nucleosyl)-tetraphosphatase (symmetrical) YqeK [Thermoanaerobacteraceae bacterium]GFN22566.1 phosphohydrolase [Thermanaeromonas sp. C210]
MEEYAELLARRLSPGRLRHSLGVAEYSARLAAKYGASVEKARLAGLLHDYARDLTPQELVARAERAGLISHTVERKVPVLLHGPVGALLLREEVGIEDEEILQAVSRHTIGAPNMSLLDKIVYLADALEPGRQYSGVDDLRRAAEGDLDCALLKTMESGIVYVLRRGQLLHPVTIEARNYLLINR